MAKVKISNLDDLVAAQIEESLHISVDSLRHAAAKAVEEQEEWRWRDFLEQVVSTRSLRDTYEYYVGFDKVPTLAALLAQQHEQESEDEELPKKKRKKNNKKGKSAYSEEFWDR